MKELSLEEKWEQSGLENGFIFYNVMRTYPKVCKRLLEILLLIEIEKIEINQEEMICADRESKGIRLDLFLKNDTHIFDVELQVKNTKELPERSRYYQGLMDIDSLKSGEQYIDMKTSHIIFICMDDIFGFDLPVYHFENLCVDNPKIKLNDRAYRHFFIAKNYDKIEDDEQKAFFNFLFTKIATNEYTKELSRYVEVAKQNVQWRHTYMDWARDLLYEKNESRAEGREEGLAEGLEKGLERGFEKGIQQTKLETARNLFLMNVLNEEQIIQATGLSREKVTEIRDSVRY